MVNNPTHYSGIRSEGRIESTPQGVLVGIVDSLPPASTAEVGTTVLVKGTGKFHRFDGSAWTEQTLVATSSADKVTLSTKIVDDPNVAVASKAVFTLQNDLDDRITQVESSIPDDTVTEAEMNDAKASAVSESKSYTDTQLDSYYNKGEIDSKVATLNSNISAIPKFTMRVVSSLPTEGDSATLYIVGTAGSDSAKEYIYVDDAWELIGDIRITVEPEVIQNNGNPVSSGAVYTALQGYLPLNGKAKDSEKADHATSADTATSATNATQDASGNTITSTYATKNELSNEVSSLNSAINTLSTTVSTLEGKVENLEGEVSTAKSYLTVTVTSATGNVTGRVITATPAEGTADTTATVGSGGSVTMTLNATSQYTVSCDAPEGYYTVASQTITTATAGLVTNITFTLVKKPVVNVTVTDTSNSGYQNGRTISVTGAESATLTTDSAGKASYTFSKTGSVMFAMTNIPTGGTCNSETISLANDTEYEVSLKISFGYGFAAVDIDISTSDCEKRCTYPATITVNGEEVANPCYGFTPASDASSNFAMNSWASHKILEGIKPVSKNGSTWKDLGTNASSWASNGTSEDYFTEFPFQWLSITNDGTKIRIIFSDKDEQPDSTFQCYAHAKGCDSYTNDQIESAMPSVNRSAVMDSNENSYFANAFHIGCFQASGSTSAIYSKKATTALTNTKYAYYWQAANARGDDYDCMSFQQWTYLQALFVLLYRSTNSQVAHSYGLANGSQDNGNAGLDTTTYGMAGSTSSTRNAFFWIHDLWGNTYQFIGGAWNRAGSSSKLYYWLPRQANSRAFNNGWDAAGTYATQASLGTDTGLTGSNSSGYIKTVAGTNKGGFCPTSQSGGSASTYFADRGYVNYDSSSAVFPGVGGVSGNTDYAGLFCCYVYIVSTHSNSYYGSRLSYRGGRA